MITKSHAPMRLTDKAIARLPNASDNEGYVVRDTDVAGFILKVGLRRKTFRVRRERRLRNGRRKGENVKLGVWPAIKADDARAEALILTGRHLRGETLRERPKTAPSLADVVASQIKDMTKAGRSAHTLANYKRFVDALPEDVRDATLRELSDDSDRVVEVLNDISRKRGPKVANATKRVLSRVYNAAHKANPKTVPPHNPVVGWTMHKEERRDTAIAFPDFPAWRKQVEALREKSPVRASFHMLSLLGGQRPGAMKVARPEHLNLRQRTWHFPKTKRGEVTIPLSIEMVSELRKLRDATAVLYPDSEWLFPSDAPCGHIVEHKEDRATLFAWAGDLRQSHKTVATALGIDDVSSRLLLGHTLSGVSQGYITAAALVGTSLREAQRRISRKVADLLAGRKSK